MLLTTSPGSTLRGMKGKANKLREVKSGILLSSALVSSAPLPKKKFADAPIIRTKSGNLRKISSKDSISLFTEEELDDSSTRVTSKYARVLLAGSGFLADAVSSTLKYTFYDL